MMSNERRIENVVNITDTLWKLNRNKMINQIESASGCKIPEDCYTFMEWCFRYGAMYMEKALGKERNV